MTDPILRLALSKRQYRLLSVFVHGGPSYHVSHHEAQKYDQRPFGSLYHRGWIAYRPGRGFHITADGRRAWTEFHEVDIARKNPLRPLSHYFDPAAYNLNVTVLRHSA